MERGYMTSGLRGQELHVGPATLETEVPEGSRGVASDLGRGHFLFKNPKMLGLDVANLTVKVVMSGTAQQIATFVTS